MNLLVNLPTNVFPAAGGSYLTATFSYIFTGGNALLTTHFIVNIIIIALGAINLALVLYKSNVYKALSLISLISVLSAFVNGERFVASNFMVNGISYGMAAGSL